MFLQTNAISQALGGSDWVFPAAECVHIASFALSIGTIAIVDLRMMGFGLRRFTAAELLRETELWTAVGLGLVIFSGLILFASQPRIYIPNVSLNFKIAALFAAVVYNYTVHRKLAGSPSASPRVSRVAGAFSLLLWLSVVGGGLFIAFV